MILKCSFGEPSYLDGYYETMKDLHQDTSRPVPIATQSWQRHNCLMTLLICRCDVLKLAMIKNSFMAEKLFQGEVYDCMCKYERAASCSAKNISSPLR